MKYSQVMSFHAELKIVPHSSNGKTTAPKTSSGFAPAFFEFKDLLSSPVRELHQ